MASTSKMFGFTASTAGAPADAASVEVMKTTEEVITDPNQKAFSDVLQSFDNSSRELEMDSTAYKVEHQGLNRLTELRKLWKLLSEDVKDLEVIKKELKNEQFRCNTLRRSHAETIESEQVQQDNTVLTETHDETQAMQNEKKRGVCKRFKRWLGKRFQNVKRRQESEQEQQVHCNQEEKHHEMQEEAMPDEETRGVGRRLKRWLAKGFQKFCDWFDKMNPVIMIFLLVSTLAIVTVVLLL